MTIPSDIAAAPTPGAPAGLRMCKQMSVPGVCRGALTYWPQLRAAVAGLSRDDALHADLPIRRSLPDVSQLGGPVQLNGALAIAPALLHGDTPPNDLYGRFAWLTLRVYEGSRTVQMTLQQLPALIDSTSGNRVAGGELVRDALAAPGGLTQGARNISALADAFVAQLHRFSVSVHSLEDGPASTTIQSVIGNMTLAAESLSGAWQATATQFETVAQGDVRELGNVDYLHTRLQIEPAVQEWETFAGVVQGFVQGLLVAPAPEARLAMVR